MKSPATIEGSAVIASTTVRTTLAKRPGTSVMKIAVPMPSGRVIATAMPTWISDPTTACSTPPRSKPSFGPTPDMSSVKKLRWTSADQPLTVTKTTALTSTMPTRAAPVVITVAANRSRACTAPSVIAAVTQVTASVQTNATITNQGRPCSGSSRWVISHANATPDTTLPMRTNFSSTVSRPSEERATTGAASSSYRGRNVWPTGPSLEARSVSGASVISGVRPSARAASVDDRRGDRVDDEGDQEEHEAGGEERRELAGAGVAEAAGDQRGDGVAADLEDARLDLERRRQDQQHGDGLAERPAEAEHRAADDAAAAERDHDGADHPPASGAERERGLLLPLRRLREHLAHHGAGHRQHHHRDRDAGHEHAEAVAREHRDGRVRVGVLDLEERAEAEVAVQPHRQAGRVLHDQVGAPETPDDRGHRRHQVDQRDQERAHPGRRVLTDVERRDQCQREGDRHGDQRDHQRAGEHRGDAEDVRLGLPGGLGEEAPPVVPQGRQRLPAEEDADPAGDDEDDGSDDADGGHEHLVRARGLARDLSRCGLGGGRVLDREGRHLVLSGEALGRARGQTPEVSGDHRNERPSVGERRANSTACFRQLRRPGVSA